MSCNCPAGSQKVIINPYGNMTQWCPCTREKLPEPKKLATSEFVSFCEDLKKTPIKTLSTRDEFLKSNSGFNKISGSYAVETMFRNGWAPKAYYDLPHGNGWIYESGNSLGK